jgi:hypothetical protein
MLFHARVQFEFQIRDYSTTCINFYIFQICLKVFYTVIINVSHIVLGCEICHLQYVP